MAYRSNGPGFDFDAHPLSAGQFYSELFPTGKVMVGWGRSGRSKWVQLDQAEIVNFLEHAAEMVRTDDSVLEDLLGQVAKHLATATPMTILEISAYIKANPEAGPRFAEILTGDAGGDLDVARETFTHELRSADITV